MNLKKIFLAASQKKFAIGAFNAANLEVIKGIVAAAEKLKSPVIIETSPGEADYLGLENLVVLVKNLQEKIKIPLFTNLDHGKSLTAVEEAVKAGYEMVHFDGSSLPFEENKRLTKKAVLIAHKKGVLVEGELGFIAGKSAFFDKKPVGEIQKEGVLTDPRQAKEFVKATGVDVLAVFVGNVHGVYQGEEKLDLQRLAAIQKETGCWLSLHGGSGISPKMIKEAIKRGVVKVNINTELRMAFKKSVQQVFVQSKEMAVYKLMPPVIKAVQKVVEAKIKVFNSGGRING